MLTLWSNKLIERMVTTAEEVTKWYRQPGISVQFNTSYRMQLWSFQTIRWRKFVLTNWWVPSTA